MTIPRSERPAGGTAPGPASGGEPPACLLSAAPRWRATIRHARRLLVGCDFDGTLAEIAAHPGDATPLAGAMEALAALARLPNFRVALVSGRELDDLRRRCPAPGVWHVGAHGSQADAALDWPAPAAADAALLAAVQVEVRAAAAAFPATFIEAKPGGIAWHFRARPDAESAIRRQSRALAARHGLHCRFGRRVAEFSAPGAFDKGDAVQLLMARLECDAALYFGDDISDEDVFERGDPRILGVWVRHCEREAATTRAEVVAEGPAGVLACLRALPALVAVSRA